MTEGKGPCCSQASVTSQALSSMMGANHPDLPTISHILTHHGGKDAGEHDITEVFRKS